MIAYKPHGRYVCRIVDCYTTCILSLRESCLWWLHLISAVPVSGRLSPSALLRKLLINKGEHLMESRHLVESRLATAVIPYGRIFPTATIIAIFPCFIFYSVLLLKVLVSEWQYEDKLQDRSKSTRERNNIIAFLY